MDPGEGARARKKEEEEIISSDEDSREGEGKRKKNSEHPSQQVHPRAESRKSISLKRFDANPLSNAFFFLFSNLPYSHLSPLRHFLFFFPSSPRSSVAQLAALLSCSHFNHLATIMPGTKPIIMTSPFPQHSSPSPRSSIESWTM